MIQKALYVPFRKYQNQMRSRGRIPLRTQTFNHNPSDQGLCRLVLQCKGREIVVRGRVLFV